MGFTYRDSGVDIEGGNRFVKKIQSIVRATFTERVITDIGGFGALYSASFPEMSEPVLVSGTDGVGTKLKLAQMMKKHDTIGIDAVAMCVNDILVSGARPLFFLDYIACGKLDESVMVDIVKGIARGCKLAQCSLIGGETAEHPSVMDPLDYDIAGFAVGIVDRKNIINGSEIKDGDVIIGLPSSGIHSNGFSLVRKLLFDVKKYDIDSRIGDFPEPLGPVLLEPTRIYSKAVTGCLDRGIPPKGMVHITGGGFYENIPRILPDDCTALIRRNSFEILPVFKFIQAEGGIDEREMFTTFNMGIGMIMITDKNQCDETIGELIKLGEKPVFIGEIVPKKEHSVIIE